MLKHWMLGSEYMKNTTGKIQDDRKTLRKEKEDERDVEPLLSG